MLTRTKIPYSKSQKGTQHERRTEQMLRIEKVVNAPTVEVLRSSHRDRKHIAAFLDGNTYYLTPDEAFDFANQLVDAAEGISNED